MELKYIRTRNSFAIFSSWESHNNMARGMDEKPQSAGMCTIAVGYELEKNGDAAKEKDFVSVHCYGNSTTLNLKSDPEDGAFIQGKINSWYR